jgi:ATP-dependent Clp protease adaptor protein ClpS
MPDELTKQTNLEAPRDGAGMTTLQAPVRKPAPPKRLPRKLPPFKVLLHNDDVNTFEHVIRSIVQLTTLTTKEALLRALEAHEAGVTLLLVTHQERAELYVEQFMSLSLSVTIEPA